MTTPRPHQTEPELRQRPPRTLHGFPWRSFWFYPVVAAPLLLLLWKVAFGGPSPQEALAAKGESTSGAVTATHAAANLERYGTHYEYAFVVNGQSYAGSFRERKLEPLARPGDPVSVLYLPDDPRVHFAQRGRTPPEKLREAQAATVPDRGSGWGAAVVVMLGLAAMAAVHVWRVLKRRSLFANGLTTPGTVVRRAQHRHGRGHRDKAEIAYSVAGRDYKLVVDVTFLTIADVFKEGATVTVLYRPGAPADARAYAELTHFHHNPLIAPAKAKRRT
jgi:hypothetical protein